MGTVPFAARLGQLGVKREHGRPRGHAVAHGSARGGHRDGAQRETVREALSADCGGEAPELGERHLAGGDRYGRGSLQFGPLMGVEGVHNSKWVEAESAERSSRGPHPPTCSCCSAPGCAGR
ncbi:hypothetical protein ALMP_19820 [Streptomyces sp. A012304]|nr:hypothetical protein ALMP_19820 [Streptomyces sp. A012304]